MKTITQQIKVIVLGLAVAVGLSYAFAWTGPQTGTTPPNNNVAAPLNVSNSQQVKLGSLTVNGLSTATYPVGFTAFGESDFYGSSVFNGAIQIIDGTQGAGKILQSNASGTASWVATSSLGIDGNGSSTNSSTDNTAIISKALIGTFCGDGTALGAGSGGTRNVAAGPWIPCQGHNPAVSCPKNYQQSEYAQDARPDEFNHNYYTCINTGGITIPGCTNINATNYNQPPGANSNNGSCQYSTVTVGSLSCSISSYHDISTSYTKSGMPGGGDGSYSYILHLSYDNGTTTILRSMYSSTSFSNSTYPSQSSAYIAVSDDISADGTVTVNCN